MGKFFKVWPSLSILSPFVGSLFPILFEGQSVTCLECISAAISSTLPCLACGVCACKVYVALFFSQSALLSRGTRTHEIARLSVFRRINIELNLLDQNMRLYGPRKKCSPINPVPTPPLWLWSLCLCVAKPLFFPKHIITKTTTSFFVSWRGTLYLLFRAQVYSLGRSDGRHSEQNCNLKSLCTHGGGPTDRLIVSPTDRPTLQSEFGLRNVHRPQ